MDLAALTYDAAKALEGTSFRIELANGAAVSLRLDQVQAYASGERPRSQAGGAGRRDPFALQFLGPRSPILPQAIYTLRGDAELDLFIVPVGQTSVATQYEAVFT